MLAYSWVFQYNSQLYLLSFVFVVRTGIEPVISHLDAYSTLGVSDLVRLPTRHLTKLTMRVRSSSTLFGIPRG